MEVGDIIDSEIMQLLPIDFAKDLVGNLMNSMSAPVSKQPPKQVAQPTPAPAPKPREEIKPRIENKPPIVERRIVEEPVRKREEPRHVNVQPVQYQTFENDRL